MSNIDDLKKFYGLVKKPKLNAEEQRAAEKRERQRRLRKEELYSSRLKIH